MSFTHAVETSRKDKTRMFLDGKSEICIKIMNGETIVIRQIVFYKSALGGILDDDNTPVKIHLPTTYLKTCPTLKIPIPVIRRVINYDNKFFLSECKKVHTPQLNTRTGVLYAPFLYFYFEESFHEETRGYIIKTFPKYSSKLDRNLTFVDRDNHTEREDEDLKAEATGIYILKRELQRQMVELQEKLDEIDIEGRLQQEFASMEDKLIQNGGGMF